MKIEGKLPIARLAAELPGAMAVFESFGIDYSCAGDRSLDDWMRRVHPEQIWGTTLPLLRDADAVIANLECAITRRTEPWGKTPKAYHLRTDPSAVEVLRAANVRCVSLANDHALDYGEEGLLDTLDHLDDAGIAHAGAGRSLAQAASPAIVRLADLTVGVVAVTDHEPAFEATRRAAGTHFADIQNAPPPAIGLEHLASHCHERRADVAVLSLHWGPELVTGPSERFREFARAAIDAGFDIVHGHAAHLFQGVEIYKGRPIFYDTGDFIDDYSTDDRQRSDWSFISFVDVQKKRIERIRMVPVRMQFARVDLANGVEAEEICRRMSQRCAALGTEATGVDGAVELPCEALAFADVVH